MKRLAFDLKGPLHLTRRAALLAIGAAVWPAAWAEAYPSQVVRLIVPYPPGGTTDAIARLYGKLLQQELKQPVILDNRAGASTNIGSAAAATAKADGYTLLFGANPLALNPVFGPKPPFDPMRALDPVSLIARVPFALAANPAAPFSSVEQLVAAAKAEPGKYRVGSAQLDVYVELLKSRAGIDLLHVPYKGGGQAITDAIGGQVEMAYALVPVLAPQVKGGKLKALGVASRQRSDALPGVPTFLEGKVDYEAAAWYGLFAPAGTPTPVVERLAMATRRITADREFIQTLATIGAMPEGSTPQALRAMLRAETLQWEGLARENPKLVESVK